MATAIWPTWRSAEGGGAYGLYSDGYYASNGAGAAGSDGPFATEAEAVTAANRLAAAAAARYAAYQASRQARVTTKPRQEQERVATCGRCGTETLAALMMSSSRGAVCPDCYDDASDGGL